MFALEEVRDLLLADFGVADVSAWRGPAHVEVEHLGLALLGAAQRPKQLPQCGFCVKSLHFLFIIIN